MNNESDDSKIKAFLIYLTDEMYAADVIKNSSEFNEVLNLYRNNYRHSYSDILNTLREKQYSSQDDEWIDILNLNMETLKNDISPTLFDEEKRSVNKFYDHTSLEIARLVIYEQFHKKQNDLSKDLDKNIKDLDKNKVVAEELKKDIENAKVQLTGTKTEVVAILSIFASIILAFSGGLALNNQILTNMHMVSIYRLTFMALIIGFVLFNIIFGLMHIVGKIIGKDISHKCNNCSECDANGSSYTCDFNEKIKLRYPYVYYINLMLIKGAICTFIAWLIDIRLLAEYIRNGFRDNLTSNVFSYLLIFAIFACIGAAHWYRHRNNNHRNLNTENSPS